MPSCFELVTEPCAVCIDLTEAIAIIEETTQALEEDHHTIDTIVRARRFLTKARHRYDA